MKNGENKIMYEGEPKEEKIFRNCPSFFFTRLGGNVIEMTKTALPEIEPQAAVGERCVLTR